MADNILNLLRLGGPVAMVLVLMSVIATALTFLKIYQFFRDRVGRHREAEAALGLWTTGQKDKASALMKHATSPLSRVVGHAFDTLAQAKLPLEQAKEDVLRLALDEVRQMKSYLRAIEVIAQTGPLVGLLGTVVGMIEAFNRLANSGATVNPGQLAGGIWTALLATALGLIIAIVFTIAGAWFEARVEGERAAMESLLTALFARESPDPR